MHSHAHDRLSPYSFTRYRWSMFSSFKRFLQVRPSYTLPFLVCCPTMYVYIGAWPLTCHLHTRMNRQVIALVVVTLTMELNAFMLLHTLQVRTPNKQNTNPTQYPTPSHHMIPIPQKQHTTRSPRPRPSTRSGSRWWRCWPSLPPPSTTTSSPTPSPSAWAPTPGACSRSCRCVAFVLTVWIGHTQARDCRPYSSYVDRHIHN